MCMDEIRNSLEKVVTQRYGEGIEVELDVAPEETGADYATNVALRLTKVAQRNPMIIAEELCAELERELEQQSLKGAVVMSVAKPGFLNFCLSEEYFKAQVREVVKLKQIESEYTGKTIVTEFSDPNPFKVLHVGHLYTSIVGDSVSRLLEAGGAKVVRVNFGGDVGMHVAKTIYCMRLQNTSSVEARPQRLPSQGCGACPRRNSGSSPEEYSVISCSKDAGSATIEEIARCYVEGTRAYEEDEEAKERIRELNKIIYDLAALGEDKCQERLELETIAEDYGWSTAEIVEVAKLYWLGRKVSYEYFKDFYAQIGLKFDKFYPESTVVDKGREEVLAHVGTTYEESDGAIVFRGEKVGLHTRVFINREGVPTYEAKDVGLIFTKWDDWHFDESIVITGNEQRDYMKVVLASVEEYAPKLVERTRHYTHGLVKLKGGVKMSSRKGNFLKAVDTIQLIKDQLNNLEDESCAQTNDRAEITLAALKYAFLKYKMGGDIVFDPEESVSMTGNSGVYLLYAVVRAKKILQKPVSKAGKKKVEQQAQLVKKLCKKIVQFKEVLAEAMREKAPYKLSGYLYELAQEFSRFYEHVPVAGNEEEGELREIVGAYAQVMEHGLDLLGIEVPEEM